MSENIKWKDAKEPPEIIYHDVDEDYEMHYSTLCLVKTKDGYALARWYEDEWLDEESADRVNAVKYVELPEE